MRTSELMSSTMRRVLLATNSGSDRLSLGNFWSLVDTVVRNMLIDRFRRNGVRREVLRRMHRGHAHGRRDEVTQPPALAESRESAARLLALLDEDEMRLAVLRLGGLSWHQVGEALGVTEATARQRWASVRRKAREVVG